ALVFAQESVYQDIDCKHQKAIHVAGKKNGQLRPYTRVFNAYNYLEKPSIGRIRLCGPHREHGYGHMILKASIEAIYSYFKKQPILISAQQHLEQFYNLHGFFTIGDGYLEDGIPHIKMLKDQS